MKETQKAKSEGSNLHKCAGLQFDPDETKLTLRAVDEINCVRGLLAFLDDAGDDQEEMTPHSDRAGLGREMVKGWVDQRLGALADHLTRIVRASQKPDPSIQ